MKTHLSVALALATAAITGPASALSYFSIPGQVDPGLAVGEHKLITFDTPMPIGMISDPTPVTILRGVTLQTSGRVGVYQGTTRGVAAAPSGDTTQYLAVGKNGSATIDFTGYLTGKRVTSISLFVGSLDSYNTLKVLKTDGTVLATLTGTDFANVAANGDQFNSNTNRRLYLTFSASEHVGGLTFMSSKPAFELDDIAVSALKFTTPPVSGAVLALPTIFGGSASLVPEPAAWTLMLAGFAFIAAAARRRRDVVAA